MDTCLGKKGIRDGAKAVFVPQIFQSAKYSLFVVFLPLGKEPSNKKADEEIPSALIAFIFARNSSPIS